MKTSNTNGVKTSKPKFKTDKVYQNKHGKWFIVEDRSDSYAVYSLDGPVHLVEKTTKNPEYDFSLSAEETVERFLEKTCKIDLEDNHG